MVYQFSGCTHKIVYMCDLQHVCCFAHERDQFGKCGHQGFIKYVCINELQLLHILPNKGDGINRY